MSTLTEQYYVEHINIDHIIARKCPDICAMVRYNIFFKYAKILYTYFQIKFNVYQKNCETPTKRTLKSQILKIYKHV